MPCKAAWADEPIPGDANREDSLGRQVAHEAVYAVDLRRLCPGTLLLRRMYFCCGRRSNGSGLAMRLIVCQTKVMTFRSMSPRDRAICGDG
jgi:hypothetical protein